MNCKHKYTKEILEQAVKASKSYSDVLRQLNIPLAGGNHSHIKRKIHQFEIDTSHFEGGLKLLIEGGRERNKSIRLKPEQILVKTNHGRRTKHSQLTRALIESHIPYACARCKCGGVYNNLPLVLEVDHINEDWSDNSLENLQFLCPNCHSQKTKETTIRKFSE